MNTNNKILIGLLEYIEFNSNLFKKLITEIEDSGDVFDQIPTPEQVKEFLLNTFKHNSWDSFIKVQPYGFCLELALLISTKFPQVKLICGDGGLSKKAAVKLKAKSIADKQFVHYFNKIGNTYYDFGKGTNTENGVYLLLGLGDVNSVELTQEELNQYYKLSQKAIDSNYI